MVKNKLEAKFSESIKADSRFWGMKLQNNMLAHTVTPADFIVHFHEGYDYQYDGTSKRLISNLVECKQITIDEEKSYRLQLKRLKQSHSLDSFAKWSRFHRAYYLIGFYDGGWTNSEIYLIPVDVLLAFIKCECEPIEKKSINKDEFKKNFSHYQIKMREGNVFNLNKLIQNLGDDS